MNPARAAHEFRRRYRSIRGVQRIAFCDHGARCSAATFNAAQHPVNEEIFIALEKNHISGAQHLKIPAPHEYVIARTKPWIHVAIQQPHARRSLRANLGADRVGVDLRTRLRSLVAGCNSNR